ncbi:ParB/RepB/Spo0J family partition protein [Streptomyces hydrogenans]|uniref:ParB/RepB/Spo0J family partition protein n=1 Tax=Streptomyces TaxID=1883 RepID=UPI0036272898
MAGKRVALSSLAGERVEAVPGVSRPTLVHIAPADVYPTPLNPRIDFGQESLVELGESMRGGQLAPCVGIPRARYLELFPEHTDEVPSCKYVMAAGERRWRAARAVNLETLDLHIRQDIAESRVKFLAAVLAENIERQNFNFIEEAQGLQQMLAMSGGSQAQAARQLSKSPQWLSQRLGILRLSPAMQEAVIAGKLTAFREMRKYAAMPADEQMTAWQADQLAAQQRAEERRQDQGQAQPAKPRPLAVSPAANPNGAGPAVPPDSPAPKPETYTAVYTEAEQPLPDTELPHDEPGGPETSEGVPGPRLTAEDPSGNSHQEEPATAGTGQADRGEAAPPAPPESPQVPEFLARPKMPWNDGAAVADIVTSKMPVEQLHILFQRLQLLLEETPVS